MNTMKESTTHSAPKPPSRMTSRSRQHALTRSQTVASHLVDTNLSLPKSSNGIASSLSVGGRLQSGFEASENTGKTPKKILRHQKSLAELFGEVIYKSKVQLQELFSRGDRHLPREQLRGRSRSHASRDRSADVPARAGPSVEVVEVVEESFPEDTSAASNPKRMSMPILKESLLMRSSQPNLSTNERLAEELQRNTPNELFCVDRPMSSRSLDTLRQKVRRDSEDLQSNSSQNAADRFLRPDVDRRVRPALVKSSSDSLCRLSLVLPGEGAPLMKASSDDTCFTRRTPSPLFFSREVSGSLSINSRSSNSDCSTVSVIVDWLLVSSVEAAYNEPLLCSMGVDAIVDVTNVAPHRVPLEKKVTCPCACNKKHYRAKLNIALDDIEWENIEQHFEEVNTFIHGWRQRQDRVLVVSYLGRSRGPAIVVQHLMNHFHIPLEPALAHVRVRHPQTRINTGFMRSLQRLEKRLAELSPLSPPLVEAFEAQQPGPRTAWEEF